GLAALDPVALDPVALGLVALAGNLDVRADALELGAADGSTPLAGPAGAQAQADAEVADADDHDHDAEPDAAEPRYDAGPDRGCGPGDRDDTGHSGNAPDGERRRAGQVVVGRDAAAFGRQAAADVAATASVAAASSAAASSRTAPLPSADEQRRPAGRIGRRRRRPRRLASRKRLGRPEPRPLRPARPRRRRPGPRRIGLPRRRWPRPPLAPERRSPRPSPRSGCLAGGVVRVFRSHDPASAGALRPVERLVDSAEQRRRVVVAPELGHPGRDPEVRDARDGLALDRELEAAEEPLRVLERRLREDHRELVAADAARDVGAADDRAQALGDLAEDGVAAQMADLLVDRFEVVQVEEDQGEPSVVTVGALHLLGERLVEVAAVVQDRQRVAYRQLVELPELPRVLDRPPGVGGELFQHGQILLLRLVDRTAPEDRERARR